MKISDLRDLRGMSDEEVRAYLHELVDFIVDEAYWRSIEYGGAGNRVVDGWSDSNYGVVLKAVFHEEMIFDNEKGWVTV